MDTVDKTLTGPDACLAFLILNQDEWRPEIQLDVHEQKGSRRVLPVTLIGVVE